jgi:HAE1 family hydrophobic/amphiphilic exporter-1
MFTVPMGSFGGFIGLVLTHQGMNIYSQIGMIMLIGMVTKNRQACNQLRDSGLSLNNAIIDASARRLRPNVNDRVHHVNWRNTADYLYLSLSESRIAVGTVIFFCMAFATFVILLVIPASTD